MATYAIGDIQGCFDGLLQLLDKIDYNPKNDKLIFVGDVVNRGDKSLQTLNFIRENNHQMVLGNHDFHLLACYFGINKPTKKDTFFDVLEAKNIKDNIDFLINQDIVIYENNSFFVHAGIPPIWQKDEVLTIAGNLHKSLQQNPQQFIKNTFGNQNIYQQNLGQNAKMQYQINAFMRMRFCTKNGELNFSHKSDIAPENYQPWFENNQLLQQYKIYFGHWSSLKNPQQKNLYPLDTGYIWGGELSCVDINTGVFYAIKP